MGRADAARVPHARKVNVVQIGEAASDHVGYAAHVRGGRRVRDVPGQIRIYG